MPALPLCLIATPRKSAPSPRCATRNALPTPRVRSTHPSAADGRRILRPDTLTFFLRPAIATICVKLTASGLWICVSAVSGFPGSFKSRGARPSFPLTDTMPPKKSIKKAAPAKKEKRAPGPYMVFCKEMRPKIIKENPKLSFGEVGKALGAAWGKLSDAQKAKVRPAPARDDARAHAVGAPPVSRAY